MEYIKNPETIEKESFIIIQDIIDTERKGYLFNNEFEKSIIKRCIHTSADFDYLDNIKITDDFEKTIISALKNKATVYTDTNMAKSGINKNALDKIGSQIKCFISEPETAQLAKELQITRSMASVRRMIQEPGDKIVVVGNAPTFLYQTLEEIDKGDNSICAIIGVPVGFVGAAESKDTLASRDIPHVAALGRKGGSNVAAAIMNAVLYHLVGRD